MRNSDLMRSIRFLQFEPHQVGFALWTYRFNGLTSEHQGLPQARSNGETPAAQ